jgi:hypothetical protein
MVRCLERWLNETAAALARRGVVPESVTLAASVVSATAGLVLAGGGAVGDPRWWLLVPALGLARLVLFFVEARLVDCRASIPRRQEHSDGQR